MKQLLLTLLLLIASLAFAQDIDTQKDNIEKLRNSAQYEEGLRCAEQLLSQYKAVDNSTAMNLALVNWQIKTFNDILALSNEDRIAFAATDTLWDQATNHFSNKKIDAAKKIIVQRKEARKLYLGYQHPDYGESTFNLALMEHHLGNFDVAINLYKESLSIIANTLGQQSPIVCKYTNNLIESFIASGKCKEALSIAKKNVRLCKAVLEPKDPEYLEALDLLVVGFRMAGDREKAIEALTYNYNLKIELFGKDNPSLAETLYSLASLEALEGKYVLAETHYLKGRELLETGSGPDNINNTFFYNALGKLYIDLGEFVKARECLSKSLIITENYYPENHPKIAVIYSGLTALAYKQKEFAKCMEFGNKTRSLLEASDNNTGIAFASATSTMALACKSMSKYSLSDSLHTESIALFRELYSGGHFNLARIISNHGSLFMSINKVDDAISKFTESQQMLIDIENTTCGLYIDNLRYLGIIALHQKRYNDGIELLNEAVAAYEMESARTGSGNRAAQHLDSPYPALSIAKLAVGDKIGAWMAIENHSGRSLNYSLQLASLDLPAALTSKRDSLSMALLSFPKDSPQKSNCQAKLAAVNRKINELQQSAAYTKATAEMLESIPENTTVVGWLEFSDPLLDDVNKAYTIASDGTVNFIDIDYTNDLAEELIKEFSQPKLGIKFSGKKCTKLWRDWIEPIWESCSGSEKLIVIPPDELAGIPLECAINNDGQHLGDLIEVYYSPNLAFAISEANPVNEQPSILALGDPPFNESHIEVFTDPILDAYTMIDPKTTRDALNKNREALAKLPRLTGSRYEATTIANLFGDSSLLTGIDASEQNLLTLGQSNNLADYYYIHIATHTLIDGMQPDKSAIVLNQTIPENSTSNSGYRYDGLLTAEEIQINWKLNARLVTLSACNSALGRKTSGNGYLGFSQPLLAAGADNLLLSMWRAGDKSTSMLMTRFYDNVTQGKSLAASLQEAKNWLRNYKTENGKTPYQHPFYWGGFVLIGKG